MNHEGGGGGGDDDDDGDDAGGDDAGGGVMVGQKPFTTEQEQFSHWLQLMKTWTFPVATGWPAGAYLNVKDSCSKKMVPKWAETWVWILLV